MKRRERLRILLCLERKLFKQYESPIDNEQNGEPIEVRLFEELKLSTNDYTDDDLWRRWIEPKKIDLIDFYTLQRAAQFGGGEFLTLILKQCANSILYSNPELLPEPIDPSSTD